MELKQLFTQIWVNVLLYLILGKVWNYMMNSGSSNNLFGNFGLNKQDYYVASDNSLDSLMNVFNNKTEFKSEGLD